MFAESSEKITPFCSGEFRQLDEDVTGNFPVRIDAIEVFLLPPAVVVVVGGGTEFLVDLKVLLPTAVV